METVAFVPEPNCGRGTITILWSCFSTIFLSTWVELHQEEDDPSLMGKAGFFLSTLFTPHVLAARGLNTLMTAWKLRGAMRRVSGWTDFTLAQAFLVLVGGLEADYDDQPRPSRIGPLLLHDSAQNLHDHRVCGLPQVRRELQLQAHRGPARLAARVSHSLVHILWSGGISGLLRLPPRDIPPLPARPRWLGPFGTGRGRGESEH